MVPEAEAAFRQVYIALCRIGAEFKAAVRAAAAWRLVHDTGVWAYFENVVTGKRTATRSAMGHQPLDAAWLAGGEWSGAPLTAPTGGSGAHPSPRPTR